MIIKRFFAAAALAVLIGTTASAAPTASLSGESAGGGLYNWTLSFTPDTNLFAVNPPSPNPGGSLGVAFQIEVASGAFSNIAVSTPNFQETIDLTQIIGIGYDPYTTHPSGISENIQTYTGVQSDLATGTVNALFVPLGSSYFTSGGAKTALTFTTAANSVRYGGLIAQASEEFAIAAAELIVEPFSFADFNQDGYVDVLDQAAFFGQWGPKPGGSFADFNGDLTVDVLDQAAFFGQWSPAGALATSTAVPEPSAIVMLGMAIAGLGMIARRK